MTKPTARELTAASCEVRLHRAAVHLLLEDHRPHVSLEVLQQLQGLTSAQARHALDRLLEQGRVRVDWPAGAPLDRVRVTAVSRAPAPSAVVLEGARREISSQPAARSCGRGGWRT
ncbi:hypothetical protein [uncultured Pseudokineococcus sp.]|uniref:hypothetical protein n=1 Tax=uncultured Pseudokineococcus sp. TaxID=1642928 RepID=UPI00261A64C5|nr:hypothetical protein [uncultured Pseudokineococcus sp.]